MDRRTLVPVVAVTAYVVFWLAVLFGYLRIDSSDLPDVVFEILRGVSVVLPALALGFLVGRWRATLAALVFLFAALLPERTVVDGTGVDVALLGTYGVSLGEALGLVIVTTPCVIAGVAVRRSMREPDVAISRGTRRQDESEDRSTVPAAPVSAPRDSYDPDSTPETSSTGRG